MSAKNSTVETTYKTSSILNRLPHQVADPFKGTSSRIPTPPCTTAYVVPGIGPHRWHHIVRRTPVQSLGSVGALGRLPNVGTLPVLPIMEVYNGDVPGSWAPQS